jgi:arsenite-transporting ATPase
MKDSIESSKDIQLKLFASPTRFIFFTGKGGVGKTSLSTAVAIKLADAGKKVLLVSTDAASNLDEMLGVELRNIPTPVPGVDQLSVLNIDPDNAAESYRTRVLEKVSSTSTEKERADIREQLSGACTTEIAAFDEFANLLSSNTKDYDHVIFDTAPTGHTLRLLSLPKAWTGFLEGNDRGASCLGPHSGLKMQEARFREALKALSDSTQTTVVLVTRPDSGAINEAARTSEELRVLGFENQQLIVNGVFHPTNSNDSIASSIANIGQEALARMPKSLSALSQDEVPLRSFDTIGLNALRGFFSSEVGSRLKDIDLKVPAGEKQLGLDSLIDELAMEDKGLIMVMGKGGVGKTTIAAVIAIGLIQHGKSVHFSTTDPAAHITDTLMGGLPGLQVDRIDPKVETQKYVDRIMQTRGVHLNEAEKALMLEDLRSPCTEEVAVFHAFSKIVSEARNAFVVLDTAPTGHSLLLMDAAGAYHRQTMQGFDKAMASHVVTPLMRLQDSNYTKIILVTLAETTPVSQAAELQEDLRRAKIEPYAWVLNKSILASGTGDPLLLSRIANEQKQLKRLKSGLTSKVFFVPWQSSPPVGITHLAKIANQQLET